jgi:hypothetical protein
MMTSGWISVPTVLRCGTEQKNALVAHMPCQIPSPIQRSCTRRTPRANSRVIDDEPSTLDAVSRKRTEAGVWVNTTKPVPQNIRKAIQLGFTVIPETTQGIPG